MIEHSITHRQTFRRFPTPETKWNLLDQLICGYDFEMIGGIPADAVKYRRVSLAIVPDNYGGQGLLATGRGRGAQGNEGTESTAADDAREEAEAEERYIAKFRKFEAFLNSRREVSPTSSHEAPSPLIGIALILSDRALPRTRGHLQAWG